MLYFQIRVRCAATPLLHYVPGAHCSTMSPLSSHSMVRGTRPELFCTISEMRTRCQSSITAVCLSASNLTLRQPSVAQPLGSSYWPSWKMTSCRASHATHANVMALTIGLMLLQSSVRRENKRQRKGSEAATLWDCSIGAPRVATSCAQRFRER